MFIPDNSSESPICILLESAQASCPPVHLQVPAASPLLSHDRRSAPGKSLGLPRSRKTFLPGNGKALNFSTLLRLRQATCSLSTGVSTSSKAKLELTVGAAEFLRRVR